MNEAELAQLIPPQQQNPLLIRKPLQLGNTFLKCSDKLQTISIDNILQNQTLTLLLFGAQWCNITKPFVKQLTSYYEQINLDEKKMEIIYISLDKNLQDFQTFTNSMPWITIGYGDTRITGLKQFYNTKAIPSLIIIDEKGQEVSCNCRQDIYTQQQDQCYMKWLELKDQQQTKYK